MAGKSNSAYLFPIVLCKENKLIDNPSNLFRKLTAPFGLCEMFLATVTLFSLQEHK
jgi:hypothetical protein